MLTELLGVTPEWSAAYLLTVLRLSAALVVIPLFGANGVPPQAKIGLALLMALVVLPLSTSPERSVPTDLLPFVALAGSEVLLGLAMGIATAMVFHALEMGASLVGYQIGFGLGEVFDPLTGATTQSMSQFYRLLATLVFFAVNGHHLVVLALVRTFEVVPAGSADLSLIAGDRVVPFFTSLFVAAVRIALPVTGALLLTDLAMGLVARTVPQINILIEGFPIKITIGVLVLAASVPLLTSFMAAVFAQSLPQTLGFVRP